MIAPLAALLLALVAPPPPAGAAPPPAATRTDPSDALLAIEELRRRLRSEPTEAGQRRTADEMLQAQRGLINGHPEDPRQALWMGDYAEDCFTLALPAGGDVDRVLYGIAGAQTRRRVREIVADMLGVAEEAERRAKATLALQGAKAAPREIADRLANVERPRRIPLLRALAEVLQVEVGEFEAGRRRALAEAAIARVETLLPELDDRTASVVARYAGLAAARIEDERAAGRLMKVARDRAGDDEALVTLADLATLRSAGLLRGPGAAVKAASVIRGTGSPARRLAMAELEARLRRQNDAERKVDGGETAGAPLPAWTSPYTELLRGDQPAEAAALRDAAIARLAEIRGDGVTLPPSEPMALLAEVQGRLDAESDAGELRPALEALAGARDAPAVVRAGALRAMARMDMARQAWAEASELFLRLGTEHPGDPAAAPAIGVAVQLAREVDRASDGTDAAARAHLERCLRAAMAGFADHPDRPIWFLDRRTLALEARADGRTPDLGPEPANTPAARTDDAIATMLLRRAAASEAWLLMQDGNAKGAMAVLEAQSPPEAGRAAWRRLSARIAAMADLDRDLTEDAEIRAAVSTDAATVAAIASRRIHALLPAQRLPVTPATSPTSDAGAARRLEALLRASACKDAAGWIDAADLLRLRGEPVAALTAYEMALKIQPDVREALLGQAEALRAAGGPERLSAAMTIHRRLLSGRDLEPDATRRDHAWWLGQLRQLQILQACDRFDAKASMRLNRLRAVDPALGGPMFAAAFAALPAPQAP